MDSRGRTPLTAQVCQDSAATHTVIATTKRCPQRKKKAFEKLGVRVWTLPHDRCSRVSLKALIKKMGQEGWLHVLCEGGSELAGALVKEKLVDELHLITSSKKLCSGIKTFAGIESIEPYFRWEKSRKVGEDIWRIGRANFDTEGTEDTQRYTEKN